MPYAFAHPAAVIPLGRLLGKFAVPSALVTGSVIPDPWYFVPFLSRADSHSVAGLFLFCLPAGLIAYAAFHLIFKQPLLALLPNALASALRTFACPSLPAAPWRAVAASLIAGILTHLAWDAVTHPGFPVLEIQVLTVGHYQLRGHQLLQHASTLLGTAFVIGWTWRKLRTAPNLRVTSGRRAGAGAHGDRRFASGDMRRGILERGSRNIAFIARHARRAQRASPGRRYGGLDARTWHPRVLPSLAAQIALNAAPAPRSDLLGATAAGSIGRAQRTRQDT